MKVPENLYFPNNNDYILKNVNLWVRGLVVLDVRKISKIGAQFSASAKYHMILTLGNST